MSHLEQILSITDKPLRQRELLLYAQSLGIAESLTRDKDGSMNEEKLVILIYDAQKNRAEDQSKKVKVSSLGLVIISAIFSLIFFLPGIVKKFFYRSTVDEIEIRPKKVIVLYDKNGNPIIRDNKRVMIEVADGVYKDYDKEGKIDTLYFYKDGVLQKRTDVNSSVELMGDPTLNFR